MKTFLATFGKKSVSSQTISGKKNVSRASGARKHFSSPRDFFLPWKDYFIEDGWIRLGLPVWFHILATPLTEVCQGTMNTPCYPPCGGCGMHGSNSQPLSNPEYYLQYHVWLLVTSNTCVFLQVRYMKDIPAWCCGYSMSQVCRSPPEPPPTQPWRIMDGPWSSWHEPQ